MLSSIKDNFSNIHSTVPGDGQPTCKPRDCWSDWPGTALDIYQWHRVSEDINLLISDRRQLPLQLPVLCCHWSAYLQAQRGKVIRTSDVAVARQKEWHMALWRPSWTGISSRTINHKLKETV